VTAACLLAGPFLPRQNQDILAFSLEKFTNFRQKTLILEKLAFYPGLLFSKNDARSIDK
jgi:hypothetical protein